jgi:hypothetical protein
MFSCGEHFLLSTTLVCNNIISLYLDPQCFCCTTLRDVILVEGCSASVISMTCILQHAVVCWVTASDTTTVYRAYSEPSATVFLPFLNSAHKVFDTMPTRIQISNFWKNSNRGCPDIRQGIQIYFYWVKRWWFAKKLFVFGKGHLFEFKFWHYLKRG